MSPARKTWVLAAFAAILAVLNLVGGAVSPPTSLPSLPSVVPDEVTKVVVYTPIERLVLTREPGGDARPEFAKWRITEPLDFPADASQVRSLVRAFGPGVPMEARVDEGNLEDYGVDDQHGKLVELYTSGDTPAVAVVVGKPAAGSSCFVRIPGADAVYRADVGSRARIYQPAADWRDKLAFEVDRDEVVAMDLTRGAETLRLRRLPGRPVGAEGKEIPGDWTLEGAPYPLDALALDAVVRAATRIRAGEVHAADYPGDFEHPRAVAVVSLKDGTTRRVVVGGVSDEKAALVKVDGRDEVYRTSGQLLRQLTQPLSALRDRTLLRFLRKDVASVALVEGGLTVVLAQGEDESWTVAQPANMAVDQKSALFAANTLAALRAERFVPTPGFSPSGARFVVTMRDGATHTVELGVAEKDEDGQPVVRVRVVGSADVAWLRANVVAELKKAFGRG